MKKHAIALVALILTAAAHAQVSLSDSAIAADIGTTALGLSLGAAEANPLGLATIPLKFVVRGQIAKIPDDNLRRETSARFTGMQLGSAAANLCVLVAGNPVVGVVCFAGGALYGYNKVRSVPTEADCVNKHLVDFNRAIATGRVYRVIIRTCEGRFEDPGQVVGHI